MSPPENTDLSTPGVRCLVFSVGDMMALACKWQAVKAVTIISAGVVLFLRHNFSKAGDLFLMSALVCPSTFQYFQHKGTKSMSGQTYYSLSQQIC